MVTNCDGSNFEPGPFWHQGEATFETAINFLNILSWKKKKQTDRGNDTHKEEEEKPGRIFVTSGSISFENIMLGPADDVRGRCTNQNAGCDASGNPVTS
jgi:hypothetical protein